MSSVSAESASLAAARLWPARRMVVTVHEPGGADTTVSLDKPFARVGRDRRAEVQIDSPDALTCQLYLHATTDGIYCLNLAADASSGWMTEGSTIALGAYRLSAAFADGRPAAADVPDLCARHGAAGPLPRLSVTAGRPETMIGDVVVHRQLTLVGRQPPGTLCVRHRTISRAHCVLFWDGDSLWLVDLLSSNGTRLNGERFGAGVVPRGAAFKLGDVRFHFVGTTPQVPVRSVRDHESGLLDVMVGGDLDRETVTTAESHQTEAAWERRFQELDERFAREQQERVALAETLAARQAAEAQLTKQVAALRDELAAAASAAHQASESGLGEAAEREQTLAALRRSIAALEEKLATTEARLAAASDQAAQSSQTAAAWKKRFNELDERLAREHQERAALAETLAAREAAEAQLTQQVAALREELAAAASAAHQACELALGEAAEREQTLAALRQSITSLEEKLATTEARLAAASDQASESSQTAAAWEKRFQGLEVRLEQQREERLALDAAPADRETIDDAPTAEALTALEEKIIQMEATLIALTERFNSSARQPVMRDGSRPAVASDEWMLDDEHTRRLLAFRHKRESKRRWRQLAWVAAAVVILAVGAVAIGLFIEQRNESAAKRLPEPAAKASFEP